MFERVMKIMDWIAIPTGISALVLSIFGHDCEPLIRFAGGLCALYVVYLIYLLIFRPKFDWHLIRGHFLSKVIAFVLLFPSLITSGFLRYNKHSPKEYSPKNLVYEENLYTYSDCDTLTLKNENIIIDDIFLETHNIQ